MNNAHKRFIVTATAFGLVLAAPVLRAQEPHAYLGAGAGVANFDDQVQVKDLGDVNLNDDDTAYKLYGGYRATENFAIEGGYRNFGKAKSGPFSVETDGWDVSALGLVPVGPVDLFAKGGVIFWNSDGAGGFPNDSDHDLMYGVGGQLNVGKVWFRLESEWFDINYPKDTQMITGSVGVSF